MLYYLRRQSIISSAKTLLLSLGIGVILYLILSRVIDFGTPFDLISWQVCLRRVGDLQVLYVGWFSTG